MSPALDEAEAAAEGTGVAPAVERLGLILIGAATLLMYFATSLIVDPRRARTLATPLDDAVRLTLWFEPIYLLYLLLLFLPALEMRTNRLLRRAVVGFIFTQGVANVIFVILPVKMIRPIGELDPGASFLEWLTALNYAIDPPVNCFPSLHVANSFFVACCALRLDRSVGRIVMAAAMAIAVATVFVKHHYVADALGGAVLGVASYRICFAPHVPDEPRAELTYPRTALLAIPAAYIVGMGIAYWFFRAGATFAWPPPL